MIGRILGNYRIVEQIGMGGMATVYKAYEAATDRYVALKTLPQYYTDDPKFVKRFQREAKALARLEHPFILPIFSYGEEDGITYLVMRYMPTGTLKEHIEQGIPALNEISAILSQIADALDYAHECGILHRDVKPSNVLLDHKGNAYLTDFGIAKIVGATVDLTGGGILGTPAYMSPEQCQGKGELSPASDQYALGIILYEMVTGQTPFQAETPLATVYMHLHDPLPPPRKLRPDLPEAVERVILKALAKDPEARFASCGALAQAFAQAIEGIDSISDTELPVVTSPHAQTFDDIVSVPRPAARRNLPVWAWGVIGALLIAGLVGGAFALGRTGQRKADQTVSQGQPAASSDEDAVAQDTVTQAPDSAQPTPTVRDLPFEEKVGEFANPTLAAIADREPDYEDDFSDPGVSGWDVGIRDGSDPGGNIGELGYADGVYFAKMPGVTSDRTMNGVGGWNKMALSVYSDFVLEIDGRFATVPDRNTDWYVTFRNWWGEDTVYNGKYMLAIKPGEAHLSRVVPDAEGETHYPLFNYAGDAITSGMEWNHIQIVAQGATIAVYANGEPIIYVVDSGYTDQYGSGLIGLNAVNFSEQPLEVHWDNLRIWDISDLETGDVWTHTFSEPIFAAIREQIPYFEDDFSNPDGGWETGPIAFFDETEAEGTRHEGERGYVDGEYFVQAAGLGDLEDGADVRAVCIMSRGPVLVPPHFVMEFDVRFTENKRGVWQVQFDDAITNGERSLKLSMDHDLYFDLIGWLQTGEGPGEGEPSVLAEHTGSPLLNITETNHIIIIANDGELAIYANDEPLFYVEDDAYPELHQAGADLFLKACHDGLEPLEVRYDNLRIWDISNLEITTTSEQGRTLFQCVDDICIREPGGDSTALGLDTAFANVGDRFSWSPDGTQVVFNACNLEDFLADPSSDCPPDLYIVNHDGTEVAQLVAKPSIWEQYPAWSPDGEWIAFHENCGLSIIQPDGSNYQNLVGFGGDSTTCPQSIAWSPDSQRIAWLVIYDADVDIVRVWTINRDGTGIQELFQSSDLSIRYAPENRIAWSPDGKSVAIELVNGSAYLIDADCNDAPTGCDESALTEIEVIPEEWLNTHHPQWTE